MNKQEMSSIFRHGKYGFVDYPSELLSLGVKTVHQDSLLAGDSICLFRCKQNPGYPGFFFGQISYINKGNRDKVNLFIKKWYKERGWSKAYSWLDVLKSFDIKSDDIVFLISNKDFHSQADKRKQYAKNRKLLMFARTEQSESFTLLGLTIKSTLEDLNKVKRKMMAVWHPDRRVLSDLSDEDFDRESKRTTDALSYVDSYLKRVNGK